jgi:hypothetical protein
MAHYTCLPNLACLPTQIIAEKLGLVHEQKKITILVHVRQDCYVAYNVSNEDLNATTTSHSFDNSKDHSTCR